MNCLSIGSVDNYLDGGGRGVTCITNCVCLFFHRFPTWIEGGFRLHLSRLFHKGVFFIGMFFLRSLTGVFKFFSVLFFLIANVQSCVLFSLILPLFSYV